MAASQQIQDLVALLPGGTYITFTLLSQLTTNVTDMSARLMTEPCNCSDLNETTCTSRYVCGAGYYEVTKALVIITAVVVFLLGWYGEDLQSRKTLVAEVRASRARTGAAGDAAVAPTAAVGGRHPDRGAPTQQPADLAATGGTTTTANSQSQADFRQSLVDLSPEQLRQKSIEVFIYQIIRAFGGTAILVVLAIFTPPVSTCLLPPCKVPAVVQSVVPLLVSFAVSAFVVIQQKFVHGLVLLLDCLWQCCSRKTGTQPGRVDHRVAGQQYHPLPPPRNGNAATWWRDPDDVEDRPPHLHGEIQPDNGEQ